MSNTRKTTRKPPATPPAAPPAVEDLDALLGEDSRPERVVNLCLRGHLQAEWDQLKAQYDAGPGDDDQAMMHERARKQRIAEQLGDIERRMRAGTIRVRLRALPRRRVPGMPAEQVVWEELLASHPPRKDGHGKVDQRDAAAGVNVETFFDALVRASIVEPALTDEQWQKLDAKLSSAQFDQLSTSAWNLNRSGVDVPFSPAVSTMRKLAAESRRRNGSASPSADSTDGNHESSPPTSTTPTDV
jgi:hypothetical protein